MSEMIKDQETSSEQGNAGRRRLVRGAVALAPLVLTLRSGALAAASCTAARIVGVDSNGKITGGLSTDVSCINEVTAPVCTGYPLTGDTKVTTQRHSLISVQQQGSNYYCGAPPSGTGEHIVGPRQVAILSSAGNTSLVNLGG
jgi:hypothetical protein